MVAALGLIAMTSGGCRTDEAARLDASAAEMGRLAAGVHLPDWPQYCSEPMLAVVPKVGEKYRWTQARWEMVRAAENRRVEWCAGHYRAIANEFANAAPE